VAEDSAGSKTNHTIQAVDKDIGRCAPPPLRHFEAEEAPAKVGRSLKHLQLKIESVKSFR
jgi:hypothetical protein